MENIEVLIHSSIKISGDKTIYIDPFKIERKYNDADFIFITHDHYDHYSEEDINKVKKETTIFISPKTVSEKLSNSGVAETNIISVIPSSEYNVSGIKFETIPAYNKIKPFHPKRNGWVRIHY